MKKSQSEKATYCMIPIIGRSVKDKTIAMVKWSEVSRSWKKVVVGK